jgi:prophage regulatory protein
MNSASRKVIASLCSNEESEEGVRARQKPVYSDSYVSPPRLLRFAAVRDRTGLSRSTIWRLERKGLFPRHVNASVNIVAWLEEDVSAWIRARTEQEPGERYSSRA